MCTYSDILWFFSLWRVVLKDTFMFIQNIWNSWKNSLKGSWVHIVKRLFLENNSWHFSYDLKHEYVLADELESVRLGEVGGRGPRKERKKWTKALWQTGICKDQEREICSKENAEEFRSDQEMQGFQARLRTRVF